MLEPGSQPTDSISVVVVDDHPVYREGIVHVLEAHDGFTVLGHAGLGDEGLRLIRERQPQIAVVDLQLPGCDGICLLESVVAEGLDTRVIVVSAYEEASVVYRAIASGAQAYLPKALSGRDVCLALISVAHGQTVIPPGLQTGVASEIRSRRDKESENLLTGRELEVLQLASEGKTTHQIAETLFLSTATVKTHLQHTYEKLHATDRASAVAAAIRGGWLE